MGPFGEYIKSAFASILNNKGRSFLTMLGIIIGISAVLTVLIIGEGMKSTVNSEIDSMGAASITVSLDNTKTDKAFSKNQLEQIASNIRRIYGISPSVQAYGSVKAKNKDYDLMVSGGGSSSQEAGNVKMVHGRYYSDSDVSESKRVVVLSQIAADTIFGYEDVVGRTVDISVSDNTGEFTIIGIREDNTMDKAYASFGEDKMIMCNAPYTSVGELEGYNMDSYVTSFTIYLDSEDRNAVIAQARSVVENIAGLRGENAVKINSGLGFDKTTDSIMNIITSVVALIAAISLLVGGIGVMNIMTVSVTERTREIGIRKSLGARTSSILTQFLAEAAILTFTGGIIGIILGLSISFLISKIVGFSFVVDPVMMAGVVFISTAIGLFFGIYPARRAAKLDPIEALRAE